VADAAQTTPTFVRAWPGSVDDDASTPPPVASSPGARNSERSAAERLTP
jgi:hypothetical protein